MRFFEDLTHQLTSPLPISLDQVPDCRAVGNRGPLYPEDIAVQYCRFGFQSFIKEQGCVVVTIVSRLDG